MISHESQERGLVRPQEDPKDEALRVAQLKVRGKGGISWASHLNFGIWFRDDGWSRPGRDIPDKNND